MQKRDKDLLQREQTPDEYDGLDRPSSRVDVEDGNKVFSSDTLEAQTSVIVPSRSAVLQACTVTSGLIAALGVLIRQVHFILFIPKIFELLCSRSCLSYFFLLLYVVVQVQNLDLIVIRSSV